MTAWLHSGSSNREAEQWPLYPYPWEAADNGNQVGNVSHMQRCGDLLLHRYLRYLRYPQIPKASPSLYLFPHLLFGFKECLCLSELTRDEWDLCEGHLVPRDEAESSSRKALGYCGKSLISLGSCATLASVPYLSELQGPNQQNEDSTFQSILP